MEDAASFEGQVVDGRFPLKRYLGGGVLNAVFQTEYEDARAAIKFVPASAAQFATWEAAGQLQHPALQRIFVGGEYRLGQTDCAYVVTEYADDNLAQILSARHLAHAEASEIALAASGALAFLHAHGWVHGHVTASNVLGVGERIVLSTDNIVRVEDGSAAIGELAADDCLALGDLLRQAIPSLPAPFLEIVQHASDPDPDLRWTAAMIENSLRGGSPAPGAKLAQPTRIHPPPRFMSLNARGMWLGGASILVVGAGLYYSSHGSSPSAPVVPAASGLANQSKPPAAAAPALKGATSAGVVSEVLPEIPQKALDTITGRVRINVNVTADSAGNVTKVVLDSPKASKYFTERAQAAARKWRFQPTRGPQEWQLHFELRSDSIKVNAVRSIE